MGALKELFGTSVGLMSLAAIVGVIIIGAWLARWVNRQIEADSRRHHP